MRKRAVLAALALVPVGWVTAQPSPDPQPTAHAWHGRSTVLGLLEGGVRTRLARLDARTLKPVSRRISVGGGGSQAFSPDRRSLAVASAVVGGRSAGSGRSRLSLVGVRTLRRTDRGLELRTGGLVSNVLWSEPGRLVLLLDDPPRVLTIKIDPLRATSSTRVDGRIVATDANGGRLVILLGPPRSIGPSRLAVVESDGRVRTTALGEIFSGWEPSLSADPYGMREQVPGLAVSPDGKRAVVVPAGDRVAEIDLDSLRVSYQELSTGDSILRRFWNWLEPEAAAKSVEGYERDARWLGADHVAVTGTNYSDSGTTGARSSVSGLRLIDTRDWDVRTNAPNAAGMIVVRDRVLAFAWATAARETGIGVRAYDALGSERLHILGDRPVDWLEAASPYVYVHKSTDPRVDVVDLRSGRIVERTRPRILPSLVVP